MESRRVFFVAHLPVWLTSKNEMPLEVTWIDCASEVFGCWVMNGSPEVWIGFYSGFHILRSPWIVIVTGSTESIMKHKHWEKAGTDIIFVLWNRRCLLTMDGSIAIQNNKIMPNVQSLCFVCIDKFVSNQGRFELRPGAEMWKKWPMTSHGAQPASRPPEAVQIRWWCVG